MAITDIYRKHHDELLSLANDLNLKLNERDVKEKTSEILDLLSKFAAKLNMHLTMEDKALYPKLVTSKDPKTSQTAREFLIEMGGIKIVVEKYIHNWSLSKNIIASPEIFIKESKLILNALHTRIDKENNILYPLADSLNS
jgi:hemerythrin-like domain-containing protein